MFVKIENIMNILIADIMLFVYQKALITSFKPSFSITKSTFFIFLHAQLQIQSDI